MGDRVVSWIEHHARRTPDRVALVDLHRGPETGYGELARRVRAVAWSLADGYGVRAGDRVAVLSRNDTRAVAAEIAGGAVTISWDEAGVAFVVPAAGARPEPDDLRAWCRDRLATYKVPVRVVLVDELPRNATGKVLKGPLRESAATSV